VANSNRWKLSPIDRFDTKWVLDATTGCHVWQASRTHNGYGIFFGGKGMRLAHRWLWIHEHGPIPRELDVCHKCDNRLCVNIDHLFSGTRLENMQDCVRKGRQRKGPLPAIQGERHHQHVLTAEQVKRIRADFDSGRKTQSQIARSYPVSVNQINRIVHRKSWKNLQEKAA
jgi:hypothetical protein